MSSAGCDHDGWVVGCPNCEQQAAYAEQLLAAAEGPRGRLLGELDDLAIYAGPIRDEMLADPETALRLVDRARRARGIRNPAAFLIAQWRSRRAPPPPAPVAEPEPDEGPPDLDTIEQAWSLSPPVRELVLKLLAVAIQRHGGFEQMRADFERRRS